MFNIIRLVPIPSASRVIFSVTQEGPKRRPGRFFARDASMADVTTVQ